MVSVSEDVVKWVLSPYGDQNFDSVSMVQSTVVDSEYAAQRVWLHEIQQELAANGHRLPPTGAVNVQIQFVNNAASSVSDTQPTQEVVTTRNCTQTIKKKIICWKVRIFYGMLAISILTVAVGAVFLMLKGNGKIEKTTSGTPALAPTLLGGMFIIATALHYILLLLIK